MYTCSWCGKPTPNYREYSHPMAGILGESGYSICDECLRKVRIEREWENEQCAEERLICPYCESSIDDPWYYDEDDEEVECPECKRTFELEIATVRTYRTKRRIEDMPDGWWFSGHFGLQSVEHRYMAARLHLTQPDSWRELLKDLDEYARGAGPYVGCYAEHIAENVASRIRNLRDED